MHDARNKSGILHTDRNIYTYHLAQNCTLYKVVSDFAVASLEVYFWYSIYCDILQNFRKSLAFAGCHVKKIRYTLLVFRALQETSKQMQMCNMPQQKDNKENSDFMRVACL